MFKKAIRFVACWIFLFLSVALAAKLIPAESYLTRAINVVFEYPRQLMGLDQHWDMFTTIANRHSCEMNIVLMDDNGEFHPTGVIVPDLKAFDDQQSAFRFHTAFSRFFDNRNAEYFLPYSQRVAEELKRQGKTQSDYESFHFEMRANNLGYLAIVRSGGSETFELEFLRGPWDLAE